MLKNIETFRGIKTAHAKDILNFLLSEEEEFDILCNSEDISFSPALPSHISSAFGDIIVFSIAGYTLSTAHIENNKLIFEAGFGEENFGSVVSVPLEDIIQITKDETPLFINITATLPKPKKPKNPFELNPRNKKFMN